LQANKVKLVVSYVLLLVFLGWCAYLFRTDIAQIKLAPILAAKNAIIFAILLSLLNYALRVARWSLYLARLGYTLPGSFSALTYIAGFAFTLSPGKVGEMVRGRYYQKIGIPLSNTTAAFFVERLMDLFAMLALAFLAVASTSTYSVLLWGTLSVMIILLGILASTSWTAVSDYMEKLEWFPAPLKKVTQGILQALISAKVLLSPKLLATGFLLGLLAWGAEGTGLMVIGAISPGISFDWAAATGIYSIAILVGALSFLPGGLGSTEAVMIALLTAHGYPMPDAILMTMICRLVTLWFAVVIGWIAVASLRRNSIIAGVA